MLRPVKSNVISRLISLKFFPLAFAGMIERRNPVPKSSISNIVTSNPKNREQILCLSMYDINSVEIHVVGIELSNVDDV